MSNSTVGFLGAGRMATALAHGLIQAGFTIPSQVTASDVSREARVAFEKVTSATAVAENSTVLSRSKIIVLAVKPQVMASLLNEIAPHVTPDHLVISIAAGIPLARFESALENRRIVRVMPNTPALVGAGAAGFTRGKLATADDAQTVERMFNTVGIASEVPESLLDAVTGLSGSGPAYAFEIIEALSDGGVLAGLPRETATRLAAQTILGAAKMVLETGLHPGSLKDAVTSPGGTTIAGLHELEKGALRGTLMSAVWAATARARELGQGK